jgi:outer membrane protein TolC
MSQMRLMPNRIHPLVWAASALFLTGCATITPEPLTSQSLRTVSDQQALRKDVEPVRAPLTLEEALARGLKYNMDRRVRMMEESLALGQLDVAKFDMLPKLVAGAGYSWRDNDRVSRGFDPVTRGPSNSNSVSSDREHQTSSLEFSWSLLDLGMGYYGSRQAADRMLVAVERRRKAMHLLMQDIRTAYWRAASAQLLREDVKRTIALAESALADSRTAEFERVRNPLDALRYQRQLLENLRLLESIDQELSSAQVELASLINAPLGQPIPIATSGASNVGAQALEVPIARMEETALVNNPELRESHYNARIAREEVRRTLVRLFPNLSFNYGLKYDSDSYLVNRNWQEAGLNLSLNLFNLLTGPTQVKLAEAGVALADQRARGQFDRADAIYNTDSKIAEVSRNRQQAQAQSKLDVVSNETAAILSLLRRYQALAQVHAAENRLLATLGLEPQIGSTSELSLKELTEQLQRAAPAWLKLTGRPAAQLEGATQPAAQTRAASVPVASAAPTGRW